MGKWNKTNQGDWFGGNPIAKEWSTKAPNQGSGNVNKNKGMAWGTIFKSWLSVGGKGKKDREMKDARIIVFCH